MAIHQINTAQKLPISLQQAWDFISSPDNLKHITPENMGFEITNGVNPSPKMHAGQIITYNLKPLPGLAMEWVTEITHVDTMNYFVDEQRFGPYAMWHHEHSLKAIDGGVLMEDLVHYKLPFGFLGNMVNSLFIRKKILSIFDYRYHKLESLFGKFQEQKESVTLNNPGKI